LEPEEEPDEGAEDPVDFDEELQAPSSRQLTLVTATAAVKVRRRPSRGRSSDGRYCRMWCSFSLGAPVEW